MLSAGAMEKLVSLLRCFPLPSIASRKCRLTGLAHDDDVVATAERIREEGARAEEDIRVRALGLAGRRSIKVPLLQLVKRLDRAVEGLFDVRRARSASDSTGARSAFGAVRRWGWAERRPVPSAEQSPFRPRGQGNSFACMLESYRRGSGQAQDRQEGRAAEAEGWAGGGSLDSRWFLSGCRCRRQSTPVASSTGQS